MIENQQFDNGDNRDKKPLESCEHRSERRTAQFLVRQLGQLQDQLCDLINDMRTFEHYSEIEDAGYCLMLMQRLKRKYRKFADYGNQRSKRSGVFPSSTRYRREVAF